MSNINKSTSGDVLGMIEAMREAWDTAHNERKLQGAVPFATEARFEAMALAALKWLANPENWTDEMAREMDGNIVIWPDRTIDYLEDGFAAAIAVRIKELEARE